MIFHIHLLYIPKIFLSSFCDSSALADYNKTMIRIKNKEAIQIVPLLLIQAYSGSTLAAGNLLSHKFKDSFPMTVTIVLSFIRILMWCKGFATCCATFSICFLILLYINC